MTIAEKLLAGMSTERLKELVADWSTEAALAPSGEAHEVAKRMVSKYRAELERRGEDGGSGESD